MNTVHTVCAHLTIRMNKYNKIFGKAKVKPHIAYLTTVLVHTTNSGLLHHWSYVVS